MFKKFFVLCITTLLLLVNLGFTANASSVNTEPGQGNENNDSLYEVDYSVFDQLADLNLDNEDVTAFIEKAGWVVASKETLTLDANGQVVNPDEIVFNPMYVDPKYYTVTIWANYNDRQKNEWTIYTTIGSTLGETYPSTFDVFSIDWDASIFNYRSKSADTDTVWLAESKASSGTMLFNFKDNQARVAAKVNAWVGVSDKNFGTPQNTTFEVNFAHTYDVTQKSTTQGGTAEWQWGQPLKIGITWSVTKTTTEGNWKKANNTAIKTF